MITDPPNSRWAKRRARKLGGTPAFHIGNKWFTVRNGEVVEITQDELLERTWDGTHGVAR